jgi:hypothetical protein
MFAVYYQSNNVVVKFPPYKGGAELQLGSELRTDSQMIGTVIKFAAKKNANALFVTIKLLPGIKIPFDSKFIFYDNLLGPQNLVVELSSNKKFLTSKDTARGVFKSFRFKIQN